MISRLLVRGGGGRLCGESWTSTAVLSSHPPLSSPKTTPLQNLYPATTKSFISLKPISIMSASIVVYVIATKKSPVASYPVNPTLSSPNYPPIILPSKEISSVYLLLTCPSTNWVWLRAIMWMKFALCRLGNSIMIGWVCPLIPPLPWCWSIHWVFSTFWIMCLFPKEVW